MSTTVKGLPSKAAPVTAPPMTAPPRSAPGAEASGQPAAMKLLLVGPCPPPHGGISVHVATARRLLAEAGVRCRVLDVGGHRPAGGARGAARSRLRLLARVRGHARRGWTLHVHTNGHNPKSWLVALACALAGLPAPGRLLTLHSGMVPDYLATGGVRARWLARAALALYHRILCVNPGIRRAVAALGVDRSRLETAPAYLPTPAPQAALPPRLAAWLGGHRPVLSTALFFRPEYGFEVLLEALGRLADRHPGLGCLVLGSGEGEAEAGGRLRERGMGGRVLLAGDVPHDLCLTLMARSDLFVRPTLVDGDAVSVREALALGVPVVASDVGLRPPGVLKFRPGDPAALTEAIETGLGWGRGPASGNGEPSAGPGLQGLLSTYREVACGR